MKLYYSNLAGVKFVPGEVPPLGVLESYANMKKPKPKEWADAYFMDSGAFSVWRSGKTVKLEDYIAFCKEYRGMFTVYAALDVIGDAEASFRNYMKMREAGLDPLPCFHHDDAAAWLPELAKHATHIGLGGMAQVSKAYRYSWLRGIFQKYPDPKVVGFHGFGVNDADILQDFPWKTADATSIHIAARQGGIYADNGGGWKRICPPTKTIYPNYASSKNERDALQYMVEGLGCDWALACSWKEGLKERCRISVLQFEALKAPAVYKVSHPTFHF